MKQVMSNYEKQVDIGKSYFLKYDQQLLAEKFHLETDEQYLYLTYIGTRCRIARSTGTIYEKTGGEYTECRSYETVMTIYDMLCHGDGKELPPLSGKWTLVANFAAAGASPSADVSSQKYADYFAGKTEVLKQACIRLVRTDTAAAGKGGCNPPGFLPFHFSRYYSSSGTPTMNFRPRSKSCGMIRPCGI